MTENILLKNNDDMYKKDACVQTYFPPLANSSTDNSITIKKDISTMNVSIKKVVIFRNISQNKILN